MCMELVPSPETWATSQGSTSLKKLAVLQEPHCLQLGVVLHEPFPHPGVLPILALCGYLQSQLLQVDVCNSPVVP